ncbi:MAG: polysaccharide biosynthesis tyrosine autokinase [Chloroflexi bacterium]|nr:polysaccharide biosynthesis tyrosine autokinase [Chloroflexota bacterium]
MANLGVALVSAGDRVIVVDADMRRPTLHEIFGRPNVVGLSDLLSDGRNGGHGESAIPLQETGFDNLRLLSAGRSPIDPTTLLASPCLLTLLASLKEQADIILIDSAPILEAPDAKLIAGLVDATLLVASVGVTKHLSVRRAKEALLENSSANLLGTVVNRVKRKDDHYYYSTYARDGRQRRRRIWRRSDTRDYLTPGEAAQILGISKAMCRQWCRSGRLPATREWLWWRIDRDGFEQALRDTWGIELQYERGSEQVDDEASSGKDETT